MGPLELAARSGKAVRTFLSSLDLVTSSVWLETEVLDRELDWEPRWVFLSGLGGWKTGDLSPDGMVFFTIVSRLLRASFSLVSLLMTARGDMTGVARPDRGVFLPRPRLEEAGLVESWSGLNTEFRNILGAPLLIPSVMSWVVSRSLTGEKMTEEALRLSLAFTWPRLPFT